MKQIFLRIGMALSILLVIVLASTIVKIWPKNYFWVERKNAKMPVWVRGNIASSTFIIFIHGGPGSCGTAESIFEVNPGNGRFDHASPLRVFEADYAMVYWDQRHSGMSSGNADPNDSRMENFGEDLALVIRELQARYRVKHIFLVGQSWGHSVALSYLTLIDRWQDNQTKIDGYIDYKGNHDSNAPYLASRSKIIQFAEQEIAAGRDVAYWQAALQFHQQRPRLMSPDDFKAHDDNAYRAMGIATPLPARIWAFFKASIFSPLNGWKVYFNNKKTMQAEKFWSLIATDTTLSYTISRLSIPVLLIYGGKDLVAPPEVGQTIYDAIQTPQAQKTLLILPHSRHGAEGPDVPVMQKAIRDFIEKTIADRHTSAILDKAISGIQIGMTEIKVRGLLKPFMLDSGTVYWGGTGAKRIYFQISESEQIWIDMFRLSGKSSFLFPFPPFRSRPSRASRFAGSDQANWLNYNHNCLKQGRFLALKRRFLVSNEPFKKQLLISTYQEQIDISFQEMFGI